MDEDNQSNYDVNTPGFFDVRRQRWVEKTGKSVKLPKDLSAKLRESYKEQAKIASNVSTADVKAPETYKIGAGGAVDTFVDVYKIAYGDVPDVIIPTKKIAVGGIIEDRYDTVRLASGEVDPEKTDAVKLPGGEAKIEKTGTEKLPNGEVVVPQTGTEKLPNGEVEAPHTGTKKLPNGEVEAPKTGTEILPVGEAEIVLPGTERVVNGSTGSEYEAVPWTSSMSGHFVEVALSTKNNSYDPREFSLENVGAKIPANMCADHSVKHESTELWNGNTSDLRKYLRDSYGSTYGIGGCIRHMKEHGNSDLWNGISHNHKLYSKKSFGKTYKRPSSKIAGFSHALLFPIVATWDKVYTMLEKNSGAISMVGNLIGASGSFWGGSHGERHPVADRIEGKKKNFLGKMAGIGLSLVRSGGSMLLYGMTYEPLGEEPGNKRFDFVADIEKAGGGYSGEYFTAVKDLLKDAKTVKPVKLYGNEVVLYDKNDMVHRFKKIKWGSNATFKQSYPSKYEDKSFVGIKKTFDEAIREKAILNTSHGIQGLTSYRGINGIGRTQMNGITMRHASAHKDHVGPWSLFDASHWIVRFRKIGYLAPLPPYMKLFGDEGNAVCTMPATDFKLTTIHGEPEEVDLPGMKLELPGMQSLEFSLSVTMVNNEFNEVNEYIREYRASMFGRDIFSSSNKTHSSFMHVPPYRKCVTGVEIYLLDKMNGYRLSPTYERYYGRKPYGKETQSLERPNVNVYRMLCIPKFHDDEVEHSLRPDTASAQVTIEFSVVGMYSVVK